MGQRALVLPVPAGESAGMGHFSFSPLPIPLLRNSCDHRRGRAWPHRSLCGAWGSGTFSEASFSPYTSWPWNFPWDILWAMPLLTPLSVTQVEDGGKAALSRRLQPGDELVNISGTPLYGSRQEALILIKGSYRTLKMVVRRLAVLWRGHREGQWGFTFLGDWQEPGGALVSSLEVLLAGTGWGAAPLLLSALLPSGGCPACRDGAVRWARHPLAGRYPRAWPLLSLPACLPPACLLAWERKERQGWALQSLPPSPSNCIHSLAAS